MDRQEAIRRIRAWNLDSDDMEVLAEVIPELKESEDERIIGRIKKAVESYWSDEPLDEILAWLEKQGEYLKFRDKIQIGDKVTRNEDGVLVNLSQLNRVAKQGEQNLANSAKTCKDKPKFKVGDWVILTAGDLSTTLQIVNVDTNKKLYWFNDNSYLPIVDDDCLHLWTIQDAKDGDVLDFDCGIGIYKNLSNDGYNAHCYCYYDRNSQLETDARGLYLYDVYKAEHATKEQRDLLFQKMKEAGYEWDAEKKELKKVERKPAWSEEDEKMVGCIRGIIERYAFSQSAVDINGELCEREFIEPDEWLKSLKERYTWKPSDEQMKALKEACDEHWEPDGLDPLYMLYQDLKNLKG